MKRKQGILFSVLLTVALLTSGCGLSGSQDAVTDTDQTSEEIETQADSAADDSDVSDESSGLSGKQVADESADADSEICSLAKRLCGKYSYKDENAEYHILEICEFADNLYAYYGLSMDEEEGLEPDELYAYSFYGLELIPEQASDVQSKTESRVDVNILAFSIMSNLSKYQAPPEKCTIAFADRGIEVTSAFFTGKNETILFESDDRVEDAFPYMKDADAGTNIDTAFFSGLWRETESDNPYYMQFDENGEYRIYWEEPGTEVTFGCGLYYGVDEDEIGFRFNCLGGGGQPCEAQAEYFANINDQLELKFSSSDIYEFEDGKPRTFERIDEKDVPIVTIDEVLEVLTDDHIYDMYSLEESDASMLDEFYGVWISAFEQSDDAIDLVEKLENAGFDAAYVYSPEWKNLSPKSFYCVTAGICDTQDEADALLSKVKDAGYKDAYIKDTGARLEQRIDYVVYSEGDSYEFKNDSVIVNATKIFGVAGEELPDMRLVVDSDTEFADSCDTEFFGNYEEGDSPLEWFKRNKELLDDDYDSYSLGGPALIGIFEVSFTGDHIDKFYGSYWWD
ncbi:MAG: SPOR domain-containing protein [Lachnospiraceae bacterium]|nr:SPOR domain-containing protein [Lachnospiraceae bacterium]